MLTGMGGARRDRRVLVDHSTMDDAGVFAYGRGEALVQTVDFFTPVVDDPYDFGQIAAANSLSDVYAMGGRPLTALALMCVPDELPRDVLREMVKGGAAKMREAGASILGGHSVRDPELKFGYAVTGVARRRTMLLNSGARRGDRLLLTKPLGTGILSTALKRGVLEPSLERRMTRQMATLNRAAAEAAVEFGARAGTDVTGFGLIGHASQMADASRVSFVLRPAKSWFLPRTLELAARGMTPGGLHKNLEFYGSKVGGAPPDDAMGLALHDPQTSGGLLIAVPARRQGPVAAALRRRRVWCAEIGEVVARGPHSIQLVPS